MSSEMDLLLQAMNLTLALVVFVSCLIGTAVFQQGNAPRTLPFFGLPLFLSLISITPVAYCRPTCYILFKCCQHVFLILNKYDDLLVLMI